MDVREMSYEDFLNQAAADLQMQMPGVEIVIREMDKLQGESYLGLAFMQADSPVQPVMNLTHEYGYCVNIDMSDIREIARLLRICSNNLNQYARIANTTGTVYKAEIKDLQKRLDEIWDLTKKVMEMLAVIT